MYIVLGLLQHKCNNLSKPKTGKGQEHNEPACFLSFPHAIYPDMV